MSVTAAALGTRLAELERVGVREDGVWRLAWTAEDAACREWFARQAHEVGLGVRVDPAGNLWACPDGEGPWWAVGSHLDSVRGGGRFDGPLGVACAFEIAAAASPAPAVISFADEEGARFNTPTFGSKALAGRLELPAVLERADEHGKPLGEAMRAAGLDPGRIAETPRWLAHLRGFIEIHIDQSTEVERAGVPLSVVSALAARTRLEVNLGGRADHAGTTPRAERRDALAAAARLIVAADELGASAGVTATTARIHVEPNAATTIAARVRLWIDGRCDDPARLERWMGEVRAQAERVAGAARVDIAVTVASRSDGRRFDPALREALALAAERRLRTPVPETVCFAGHDAGVVAEHVPAAMLLVRNPTGVSHAPEESVSLEDAATAANVVLELLEAGLPR